MRCLIISLSDLHSDPRVNRQIRVFRDAFQVTTIGLKPSKYDDVYFLQFNPFQRTLKDRVKSNLALLFNCFDLSLNISFNEQLCGIIDKCDGKFDFTIVNDPEVLPWALSTKITGKVIFDAHEYFPREYEDKILWRLLKKPLYTNICKQCIPKTNGFITVGENIRKEYQRLCKVDACVIFNTTQFVQIQPSIPKSNKIRIAHHGGAIPSRKIEKMLFACRLLEPRFSADFFLVPTDKKYLESLIDLAHNIPNVRILPPAPRELLVETLNQYDIGMYILEPNSFNALNALPNKFFEFIQARLCLAIGPSLEMKMILERHHLGICSNDFEPSTLAREMNKLGTGDILCFKHNSHKHAHELSDESVVEKLSSYVSTILKAG